MTTNYVTKFNAGGTPADTSAPIFDNGGLVGIGTTSPVSKLEIAAGGGSNGLLISGANSNGLRVTPSDDGNNSIFNVTNAANSVNWLTVSANGKVIMNGGNVGIGTTAPSYKLNVATSTGSCDGITLTNPSGDFRGFLGRTGAGHGFFELYNESNVKKIQLYSGEHDSYINYGNVGIGTDSPGDKLDVGGKVLISDSSSPSTPPTGAVTIYWDGTNLKAKRQSDGKVFTFSGSWA